MNLKKMEEKRMEDTGRRRAGWKRGLCDGESGEQRFTASAVGRSRGHGLLLSPVTSTRASASSLRCLPASAPGRRLVSVSHLHGCRSVFLGLWSLRDRLWFRIGISQPLPTQSFLSSHSGK